MQKLLAAYRANPTHNNAQKVRAYERSHPMAVCMLTTDDANYVAEIIFHANRGY